MSEYLTRTEAITDFVNWLYEHGPNPDTIPREKLLRQFYIWKASERTRVSRFHRPKLIPMNRSRDQYPGLDPKEPA